MVDAVTPPNPAGGGVPSSSSHKPIPDPTLLTIDSIRREITMLENLFDMRLHAAEDLIRARLERIDALLDRSEEQRIEQKDDTKAAVDAALDSQKEATSKMERSISDQIASLRHNFETEIRSLHASVSDNKQTMTRIQSEKTGEREQRGETRAFSGSVIALISVGVTIVLFLMAIAGSLLAGGG